jgi:hypothetical protein
MGPMVGPETVVALRMALNRHRNWPPVVDTRNPQIGRRVHKTIPSSKVASNTTVKLVFSEVIQQP